jgi:hypothetical protein
VLVAELESAAFAFIARGSDGQGIGSAMVLSQVIEIAALTVNPRWARSDFSPQYNSAACPLR